MDLEVLEGLLDRADDFPARRLLEAEVARASVIRDPATRGAGRIGDWITYRDLSTEQTRRVRLVMPIDADIDQGQVSVLTPVGAALIGLKAGALMQWVDDRKRPHRIEVTAVEVGERPVSSDAVPARSD